MTSNVWHYLSERQWASWTALAACKSVRGAWLWERKSALLFTHWAMLTSSRLKKDKYGGKSQWEEAKRAFLWPPARSLSSAVPTVQSPDRRPDCGNSRWCRDTDRLLRPHQATSTHCLSPQKPVSSCQTCFLFVFFFISLMWPGECFLPFVPQFQTHFFPL